MPMHPYDAFLFDPVGAHTENGSLSSAVTLTPSTGATKLMIQTATQDIRFTLDGTTPTSTKGFLLRTTDPPLIIPIGANTTIKVIEVAASAAIDYQWGI